MIACFICYFVHVTSASYHCFMCMYILWLHLEEFRLSIQAELPGLADNAFDWKRMRDVCGRVTPQVLNLIADFQEQPVFFGERKRKRNINMKGIFKCVPRGLDLFLCDASIHLYSLFLCNFEIMCYIIYCYYVIVLGFRVLYNFIFDFIFWYFDSWSHYFLICLVPSALPKINTSEIQEKYEPLCVTYIMYPVTINLTDIPLFFIQFRYMIIVKFMMVSCNKNPRNRTHMSPVATAFHCPFGGVELSSYLPWSDLLLVANSWQSSSSTTSFVGTWTSSWCRSGRRSGWTPWKSRHLFISPSKF